MPSCESTEQTGVSEDAKSVTRQLFPPSLNLPKLP